MFIVVLQELHCLLQCLQLLLWCLVKSMCIPSFVLIGYCVSVLHGRICPYRNVWPEAVYCCFTRTTLFTNIWICLCASVHGFLSSFVPQFSPVFEIRELKLKSNNNNNNNKMKNCENELLQF